MDDPDPENPAEPPFPIWVNGRGVRSLSEALQLAANREEVAGQVTVLIAPGLYRESIATGEVWDFLLASETPGTITQVRDRTSAFAFWPPLLTKIPKVVRTKVRYSIQLGGVTEDNLR